MVTGQLTGPGLDHDAAGLSVPVLQRIRAGVAHPTIGAGIALSLLTQLPILFLHSLPWEALSPDNDALRLTWFPKHATLVPSTFTIRRHHPITAVFPVPPAVRPLLQAVRCFAAESDNTTGRLFASTVSPLSTSARPQRTARSRCPISTPTGPRISTRPGSHALPVRTPRTWAASSTPRSSRIRPSPPTHTCRPPRRRAPGIGGGTGEGMAYSPSDAPVSAPSSAG